MYHANKCQKVKNCWHFNIYVQDTFRADLSMKKFYNLAAR